MIFLTLSELRKSCISLFNFSDCALERAISLSVLGLASVGLKGVM